MIRYLRRRRDLREADRPFYVRPLRILAGVVLVVLSALVGWIPGPGGLLFFIPGVLLLASEVRRAALLLDRIESEAVPRLRIMRARIRRGPRPEWVAEEPEWWRAWCEQRGYELPAPEEVEAVRGRSFVHWSATLRLRSMAQGVRNWRDERRGGSPAASDEDLGS